MAQMATQTAAPDIFKYYRALEQADAAGDAKGAQEIANEIKVMEGRSAPAKEIPITPTTQTQIREGNALKRKADFNPVEGIKNLGKGLASVADIGIEGANSAVKNLLLYPTIRPTGKSDVQTERLANMVLPQSLGKTFGIEDPAYKGEALRRGFAKVGEVAGPYVEKAVGAVSEATGLPKGDVGNIASNLTLAIPGIGVGKLGAKPSVGQLRAQAIRDIDAGNKIPDEVARAPSTSILRQPIKSSVTVEGLPEGHPLSSPDALPAPVTAAARAVDEAPPVAPVAPVAPMASQAVPAAPSAMQGVPLRPNDIPAAPSRTTPEQARANMMAQAVKAQEAPALESTMSGVGSADVGKMNVRVKAAEDLQYPINLTAGKRSQELDLLKEENRLRFAHPDETSGRLLLEEDAINNLRMQQNVDFLMDDLIGAANPTDRGVVGDAINADFRAQWEGKVVKASSLYNKVTASPENNMLVNATEVLNYINSRNKATRKLAPILDSVKAMIDKNGDISVGDLIDVNKVASAASKSPDIASHYASELKKRILPVIEQAEDIAPKFKRAQNYYRLIKDEFKGKGAVERLSFNKLNSSDPKVAAEKIVSTLVSPTTSHKDLNNVIRRLKRSKDGEVIMKELKGNVIDHIFERAITTAKDIDGNPVMSYAGIKAVLGPLEKSKKLELIFDAPERTMLHDIVLTADSLFTEPAGARNFSNTAYGLAGEGKRFMRRMGTKVPGINVLVEHAEEQARLATARAAIRPDQKKLEKQLKKIKSTMDKEREGL